MKRAVIFIILFMFTLSINSQDVRRVNLIILLNDKVPDYTSVSFIITNIYNERDTINVEYLPGDLIIPDDSFDRLMLSDSVPIILNIEAVGYTKKGYYYNISFEAEFYPAWMELPYIILRIYDSYNLKSRKKLLLPDKNYMYHIDFPGYTVIFQNK